MLPRLQQYTGVQKSTGAKTNEGYKQKPSETHQHQKRLTKEQQEH